MATAVRNTTQEYKLKKQRKEVLHNWLHVVMERKGHYFPSLSQVLHWQSQEFICLGKHKCTEK